MNELGYLVEGFNAAEEWLQIDGQGGSREDQAEAIQKKKPKRFIPITLFTMGAVVKVFVRPAVITHVMVNIENTSNQE